MLFERVRLVAMTALLGLALWAGTLGASIIGLLPEWLYGDVVLGILMGYAYGFLYAVLGDEGEENTGLLSRPVFSFFLIVIAVGAVLGGVDFVMGDPLREAMQTWVFLGTFVVFTMMRMLPGFTLRRLERQSSSLSS